MEPMTLNVGDVVQVNPEVEGADMFGACLVTVTEVKAWGVQGYVAIPKERGQPPAQAYLRLKWEQIEYVGPGQWVIQ